MFLEDFSLVVLQSIVAGQAAIDEKEGPRDEDVDYEEVDENRGDVSVPGAVEVGVEGERAELEEVLDVGRDGRQDGDVVVGSKPENIRVDQDRDQDSVEDEENRVDDDLDGHA